LVPSSLDFAFCGLKSVRVTTVDTAKSGNLVNWKAGALYRLTEQGNIYVNYEQQALVEGLPLGAQFAGFRFLRFKVGPVGAVAATTTVDTAKSGNLVNWKAGALYRLTEQGNIYVNYAISNNAALSSRRLSRVCHLVPSSLDFAFCGLKSVRLGLTGRPGRCIA
jgi:outer membrane receptor for monomeric catechols